MSQRDSGRYDAITQQWIDQQVRVDFAWGNIPLQPNTDRDEEAQLDPELDNHEIAVYGYQGFPAFITGAPYDDTIENVAVPNLVGLEDPSEAEAALEAVGLVLGDTNSSTQGANAGNDLSVKSQSIPAGTLVNVGTTVSIVVFDNPQVLVPNLAGLAWPAANAAITAAGFTVGDTSGQTLAGATSENVNKVASQTPAAGSFADTGSAINYVTYGTVSTATTGSISGFNRSPNVNLGWSLNGTQVVMYVTGRDTWPTVGSTITITGTSVSNWNQTATVVDVAYDDAFNTGGTAIKLEMSSTYTGSTSTGGTWAFPAPAAVIEPTNNWWWEGMSTQFRFPAVSVLPAAIDTPAKAESYKLVITGGSYPGNYPLNNAFINQNGYLAVNMSDRGTLPVMGDVRGAEFVGPMGDLGMASIVAI